MTSTDYIIVLTVDFSFGILQIAGPCINLQMT